MENEIESIFVCTYKEYTRKKKKKKRSKSGLSYIPNS